MRKTPPKQRNKEKGTKMLLLIRKRKAAACARVSVPRMLLQTKAKFTHLTSLSITIIIRASIICKMCVISLFCLMV